jgi:hypothetical protein
MEVLTLAEIEQHDPGRERRYLCPLPACADKQNPHHHRSLALNTDTGAYVCHRCGVKGKIRERWTDRGRPSALSSRARARAAFTRAAPASSSVQPVKPDTFGVPLVQAPAGLAYVAAGLRFSPAWGASDRSGGWPAVLFPMCDQQGAAIAIHGRAIRGPGKLTRGPKKASVFASPGALAVGTVAITEGPMDALTLALCGVPALAMVATSGPDWLHRFGYGRTIMLATDADPSGEQAAATLEVSLVQFGARVSRLAPPAGRKDWNEALMRDGEAMIRAHLESRAGGLLLAWQDGRELADLQALA